MVITERIEREFITFKPIEEGVYVEQRKVSQSCKNRKNIEKELKLVRLPHKGNFQILLKLYLYAIYKR